MAVLRIDVPAVPANPEFNGDAWRTAWFRTVGACAAPDPSGRLALCYSERRDPAVYQSLLAQLYSVPGAVPAVVAACIAGTARQELRWGIAA